MSQLYCRIEIPKGSRNKYELGPRARRDQTRPLRDEIGYFFSIYKQPEGKKVDVEGWHPADQAHDVIEESRERWRNDRG